MPLCCNLPVECKNTGSCFVKETNTGIDMMRIKEKLLLDISTTNRKHDVPTAEMEKLKEIVRHLKYKVLNMYHLSNICFNVDDELKDSHFKSFDLFENRINYFLKCAEQRCVTLGRKSVGFCGQFSTGKSALINFIYGLNDKNGKLPEDAVPTTALPTYAIYSKLTKLVFENFKENIFVTADRSILKSIRHHSLPCGFPWASIIERLYYFTDQVNPNVVCVDLPGFNKDISISGQTDYKSSLTSASSCDAIIFLVNHHQGSLDRQDIDFLKKLNQYPIPILIVISRIDEIYKSQAYNILNKIKADLSENEIEYEDIILHSSRPEEIDYDEEYSKQISKNLNVIKEFINNQKDVEDDLDYVLSFIQVIFDRLEEADKSLREHAINLETGLINFIGEEQLGTPFFSRWKSIEEQAYNSDIKYLKTNSGFFTSTKEFDLNGYRNALIKIASNFRQKEVTHYVSPMNYSFVELAYVNILQYIDNVAMRVEYSKETVGSDTIENEKKYIDTVSQNYKTVLEMIEETKESSLVIPKFIIDEINNVEEDIAKTFNELKKSYSELISKAKEDFEKI